LKEFADREYEGSADWGTEVLEVGQGPGIGGITLWEGETPIPVMNPGGKGPLRIDRKIVTSGPVCSLVRVRFTKLRSKTREYTVTLHMSAFAENRFSRQDIEIAAPDMEWVIYSPGFRKLPQDEWHINTASGMFASWGRMDDRIKEIGLGLAFRPEHFAGYVENELGRSIKLKVRTGDVQTHYIVGAWRKGFNSPVAPTGTDWAKEVNELGLQLHTPITVKVSPD